jgi:hypothetical protein
VLEAMFLTLGASSALVWFGLTTSLHSMAFASDRLFYADLRTSNIYLYGGAGFGVNATGFDDVYILTMPSFQWIKWWPTVPNTGHPHNSLSCNIVDNTQMLIIGGTFPEPGDSDMCDAPSMCRNLCAREKC